MHKISVGGDIGTLEWTPPQTLQQKLDQVPAEVSDQVKKWMGRMMEGYVCVLLDSQSTAHGIAWLEAKTRELVTEAMMSTSTSLATPPKDQMN